jgi:hypothetical protein
LENCLFLLFLCLSLMFLLDVQFRKLSSSEVGLNEGDIINRVNGVKFSNAAEVCFESVIVYLVVYVCVGLLGFCSEAMSICFIGYHTLNHKICMRVHDAMLESDSIIEYK